MEASPDVTGFTTPVLMTGLTVLFRIADSRESLNQCSGRNWGIRNGLDNFFPNERGFSSQRSAMALGPQLIAHVAPGNLPIPIMMDMILGLLARSAQFVKMRFRGALVALNVAHSSTRRITKLARVSSGGMKRGIDSLDSALAKALRYRDARATKLWPRFLKKFRNARAFLVTGRV